MNEITIDQNKLEIKYILGNYKTLDSYPTQKDVLYFIIEYLFINKKENVTLLTLTKEFKDKNIETYIESLVKEGFIESRNNKIILIKNPYEYE